MIKRYAFMCSFLVLSLFCAAIYVHSYSECSPILKDNKRIFGEQEWVKISSLPKPFKARIDSGATTSSISATDIEAFEKEGEEWVQFRIEHGGKKSELLTHPIARMVRIKQSSSKGYDARYVVKLPITVGDFTQLSEFTLRDRRHLTFPVLIGRSYLEDKALIDVSQTYIQPVL